jgi:Uma2 family endonuclease
MAIMQSSRSRAVGGEEIPAEPDVIADLLALRARLETGGRRAEILEGRLVVSPVPVLWHERACRWLVRGFDPLCEASGWFADSRAEIELPPTRDRIEPDLLILSDAASLPDLESLRPLDQVLLVGEVVSSSSIRDDREVKPLACALAGVPVYLLADRFTSPATLSVYAVPGADGYATRQTVVFGAEITIPAPVGLTLDTSSLPLPR